MILFATLHYTTLLAVSELQRRHRVKLLKRFLEGSLSYEELLRLKTRPWFKRLYKEPPTVDDAKKNE